jgi:hypothetical protein
MGCISSSAIAVHTLDRARCDNTVIRYLPFVRDYRRLPGETPRGPTMPDATDFFRASASAAPANPDLSGILTIR